jgi:hypothetical protein
VVAGVAIWSPVITPVTALGFHGALVTASPPPTLAPGAVTSYRLTFRNTGIVAWQRGTEKQVTLGVSGDSASHAEAGLAEGWISPTRIATTAEEFVLPGTVGTFAFSVRAPANPGVYRVPVRLVVDGLTWLDHEPVDLVVSSDLGFHAQLVEHSGHLTLRPGDTSAPLTVRIRNTGAKAWVRGVAGQQLNLGVAGDDRSLSALGVGWPAPDRVAAQTESRVGPGGTATFTFRVRAPTTPGTYPLRLRPVVDGVVWLEDDGLVSLIRVVTSSAAVESAEEPIATADKVSLGLPSFTLGASVDPTSAVAGGSVMITASLTATTAGTALVGIEVFAPGGGAVAYQSWFHNQSFTRGQQRTYDVTWGVPVGASPGTYSVKISAYSPGWKTLYDAKNPAASFAIAAALAAPTAAPATSEPSSGTAVPTASTLLSGTAGPAPTASPQQTPVPTSAPLAPDPSFTLGASVAPATVAAGSSTTVSATVTSATATSALVDIEIWDAGGANVRHQVWFDNQSFAAGQQRTYTVTWQVPTTTVPGTYVVVIGVYAAGWATRYAWTNSAATFSVTAASTPTPAPTATAAPPTPTPATTVAPGTTPSFTMTASAVPTSVTAGGSVNVTAVVTSLTAVSALVSVEIWDAGGVSAKYGASFDNQSFAAGQQRSYPITWQVPPSAATGPYIVVIGVYAPGWTTRYSWTNSAATFSVTAATPSPTPAPTTAPTPAPIATPGPSAGPTGVQLPAAPAAYTVPAGAVQVATSAQLVAALSGTTPRDIVLADGVYDNPVSFANPNGHRLYAARLLGATLTAGINVASNSGQPNPLVRGIAFDVSDPAKTFQGRVIFSWGASKGLRVLDSTFNGHRVLAAAVYASQPDGLVVQRVQARDFTDWGVVADNNVQGSVLAVPILLEDIDVSGVSRAVPKSSEGRAEACVGVGNTATVRRVRARNCAWMGVETMNSSYGSFFSDLDIDGGPYAGMPAGAGSLGSVGLYIEHFTSRTTFQRMRIGPSLAYGVVCEGTDPNGAQWGGVSASIDNVIQDSTMESAQVGVLMGWATTRTTTRRVTFRNQYVAGITDFNGINNAYYDNDYSGMQPGALPVSSVWWR